MVTWWSSEDLAGLPPTQLLHHRSKVLAIIIGGHDAGFYKGFFSQGGIQLSKALAIIIGGHDAGFYKGFSQGEIQSMAILSRHA